MFCCVYCFSVSFCWFLKFLVFVFCVVAFCLFVRLFADSCFYCFALYIFLLDFVLFVCLFVCLFVPFFMYLFCVVVVVVVVVVCLC